MAPRLLCPPLPPACLGCQPRLPELSVGMGVPEWEYYPKEIDNFLC